jgi:uncharacterized protein YjbI with pentapeptide repeats
MTSANESRTANATSGTLTHSGQPHHTPPSPAWRPTEQWVWQCVCQDAIADFNARERKELAPSDPTGWDDTRTVSSAFLEAVLLQEPYRSALPRQGVRIVGAWFKEALALEDARLGHPLGLDHSRFEREVQLSDLRSMDSLSLEGSYFAQSLSVSRAQLGGQLNLSGARCTGRLNLERVEVKADLFMRTAGVQTAQFAEVILRGARIGGQLDLSGAHCTGTLDLNGLEVKADLFMHTAEAQTAQFAEVILRGARIGGQLSLRSARCTGRLDLNGLEVGSTLFMHTAGVQTAQFAEVILRGARIGGQLDLSGAHCTGRLDLERVEVKADLFMRTVGDQTAQFVEVDLNGAWIGGQLELRGARCTGRLNLGSLQVASHVFLDNAVIDGNIALIFARLGGGLRLDRAHVASLDLAGATLQGELRLSEVDENRPQWAEDAQLILRNATIGALQCPPSLDAWPTLELSGCSYKQLGGFSSADSALEMAARARDWFVDWLAKDRTFSPQPYHQLASVLRSMGHAETADAVLYAGKERERRAAGWGTPK